MARSIAEQNDAFRTNPKLRPRMGMVCITPGVKERGTAFVQEVMKAIEQFDAFTEDNDPYGEHDFGSVEIDGHTVFWKIDYYDSSLEFGSQDPADELVTKRVMTVMLDSEY